MKNVLMHITAQRVGERSEILKQLSSTSWLHLSAVLMKGGGASWRRGKQNNTERRNNTGEGPGAEGGLARWRNGKSGSCRGPERGGRRQIARGLGLAVVAGFYNIIINSAYSNDSLFKCHLPGILHTSSWSLSGPIIILILCRTKPRPTETDFPQDTH